MAARKASSKRLISIAGAFLFALGLMILIANLDGIEASLSSFAGISANGALGILPAIGLAGLHALQAYTFDRDAFLSCFRQILVSFWPLLLVIAGVVLLRNSAKGPRTHRGMAAGALTGGNQS